MLTALPNDELITQAYVRLDVPSDTLVRNSKYLDEFIQFLPEGYRSVNSEDLAHRIITLRKKGALPRLRHTPK